MTNMNQTDPTDIDAEYLWHNEQYDRFLDAKAQRQFEEQFQAAWEAANDREDDTDAVLFEGQNYNWMREYGGDW